MIEKINLIKSLYNNSNNSILILDYDFKHIWHNNHKIINQVSENTYKKYFNSAIENNLENGNYSLELNDIKYFYIFKNVPDIGEGIFIIEILNEDIFTLLLKNGNMGKIIDSYLAVVRHSIFGIVNVNQALYHILEKNDLYNDIKYVNSAQSRCRKIMKTTVSIKEALRYSENSFNVSQVYLSKELEYIISECRNVLRKANILIETDIENSIFVEVDKERLNYFILILMDILFGNNPENNIINISLKKSNDDAVLLLSTDSNGTDKSIYNNHSELYSMENGSQVNLTELNFYIIKCFCNTFGLKLMTGKNSENKTYFSVKFPKSSNNKNVFSFGSVFSSEPYEYRDKFSKYNIILTDFIE